MATTRELHDHFLRDGLYLRNWSTQTIHSYRYAFRHCPDTLTKPALDAAVIAMRQRGLTLGGINVRIRGINSFLTWAYAEGHTAERLRIKLLKNPPKPVHTFSDADIKRLITYRPKGNYQTRTWMLALVLLDCGLRVSEALSLERGDVDFDGLTIRVLGKGGKVRLVPMSVTLRKHLYRYLSSRDSRYVFPGRTGTRLSRHGARDALFGLCRAVLGIKCPVHPHNFRHAFAAQSMKNGLDVFRLSRILGHSSINTTQLYTRRHTTWSRARVWLGDGQATSLLDRPLHHTLG